jgi:hypothetical protein
MHCPIRQGWAVLRGLEQSQDLPASESKPDAVLVVFQKPNPLKIVISGGQIVESFVLGASPRRRARCDNQHGASRDLVPESTDHGVAETPANNGVTLPTHRSFPASGAAVQAQLWQARAGRRRPQQLPGCAVGRAQVSQAGFDATWMPAALHACFFPR